LKLGQAEGRHIEQVALELVKRVAVYVVVEDDDAPSALRLGRWCSSSPKRQPESPSSGLPPFIKVYGHTLNVTTDAPIM
jgi:hypothetical protein